jgi:sortase A
VIQERFLDVTGNTLKQRLGWLEYALYAGGVLMIAVFLFVRWQGENARQEGLLAFEQAVAEQQEQAALPEELPGDTSTMDVSLPTGQEFWSDARLRAWEESLAAPLEAPLAVLRVDRLGIDVPVYDGAEGPNLDRGVGRIRGTARVDAEGNLGIAGHRDGFFRPLKDIVVGDRLELETTEGLLTYRVTAIDIVQPDDVSVLAETPDRSITLVTCYPFYFVGRAPQRYIVKASAEPTTAKT